MTSALPTFAQLCAEHLLNSVPQGLAIAAIAWILLRITGKQNSGTRFAVWFAALIAVAALPFLPPALGKGIAHEAGAEIVLPGIWATVIFSAWVLFTLLAAARLVVALISLRSVRRSGAVLTAADLNPAVHETIERLQMKRPVTIRSSPMVRVPTAIGFFKPTILIPDWALRELPPEELKIILLHEFAHLRRWDDWTNLAQKMIRTVFCFHPAVWWIENRLSMEREMACDDAVLAETHNPQGYAACLVSLAEKSYLRRGIAMAQAAVSRARETSLRVAQILDGNRPDTTRVFKPAMGMMAAFAVVCLLLFPQSPRLVGFETAPLAASESMQPAFANSPSLYPGAAIVPAKFDATPKVDRRIDLATDRGRQELRSLPARVENRVPRLKQVHAQEQKQAQPAITRAAMVQAAEEPEWLLVLKTTQYDERGAATAKFLVWQVVFSTADGNGSRTAVFVKLI